MAGHGEATYFRWSSIMQLASSVAVGLAMFLLAILLPVFLVAWKSQDDKGGSKCENVGSLFLFV